MSSQSVSSPVDTALAFHYRKINSKLNGIWEKMVITAGLFSSAVLHCGIQIYKNTF